MLLKRLIKWLKISVVILSLFFFNNIVAESTEDEPLKFNDPIANLNGIDISKQEFLNFLSVSANLTEADFSEAPKEVVQEFLYSYAMYQDFPERIKEQAIYESESVQSALEIIQNYVLATLYEKEQESSGIVNSQNEVKEGGEEESNIVLSFDSLYFIAQKEGMPLSKEDLRDNVEIQNMLTNQYQKILVLAKAAKTHKLIDTIEYQRQYYWALQSYLADLYINDYLDSIRGQQMIDDEFTQWISEQEFFEYKAAHVYFDDEEIGKNVLRKIQNKELTFEEAVIAYSKDLISKEFQGAMSRGEWISFPQKNHPIAIVVASLEVGEMTEELVKGIEGYHIVLLNNKRKGKAPDYLFENDFKEMLWRSNRLQEIFNKFKKENFIKIN